MWAMRAYHGRGGGGVASGWAGRRGEHRGYNLRENEAETLVGAVKERAHCLSRGRAHTARQVGGCLRGGGEMRRYQV